MREYDINQFEIRSGTSDRAILEEVIQRRVYLKNFILPFIKRNGLIIDIGSHIGSFTIQACSLLHPKTVVTLEPDQDNFNYLMKNITKAKFANLVHPVQVALWNFPTNKKLYCQTSSTSLVPSWHKLTNIRGNIASDLTTVQSVQADTLDNTLKSLGLENAHIELIKIDVEGAEEQVLKGSSRALRRCKVVIGELHETVFADDEFRKLMKNFVVIIGEPFTSFRVRYFWAVRRTVLRNKSALKEFLRAAHAAEKHDSIWRARQQEERIQALETEIESIRSSISWRITAPHRLLGSFLLGLRRGKRNE